MANRAYAKSAARSASDSALRANVGKSIPSRSVFPTLKTRKSVSYRGPKKESADKVKKIKSSKVKQDSNIIDAEIVEDSSPTNVKSTRVGSSGPAAVSGRQFRPAVSGPKPRAALPAPSSSPKKSSGAPKPPRERKTTTAPKPKKPKKNAA